MSDRRAEKRHRRALRHKQQPTVEVVYRPKSEAEALRRCDRMNQLVGTPFVPLPGITDRSATCFVSTSGNPITFEQIEMVWNDALLCDAVSNWGEDGPLYETTLGNPDHAEAFAKANELYAGVEVPAQLRRPNGQ